MERFFALSALLLWPLFFLDAQVLVQTGHTDQVRDLTVDSRVRVVATAGADGTVKVWSETGTLLNRLAVGPYPIAKVALQEDSDLLAVVEERGPQEYRVAVWNWRSSEELYSASESTPVTSMAFSPRGSYLVYAVSDIRSLRFLNAANGERLPLVDRGFGVVTFFVVARSESNIMTYAPSTGEIFYFDLESGRRIESLRALPQLDQMALLPSRRHVAAVFRDELLIVDIVDGEVEERTTVGEITALAVNPDRGIEHLCAQGVRVKGNYTSIGLYHQKVIRADGDATDALLNRVHLRGPTWKICYVVESVPPGIRAPEHKRSGFSEGQLPRTGCRVFDTSKTDRFIGSAEPSVSYQRT